MNLEKRIQDAKDYGYRPALTRGDIIKTIVGNMRYIVAILLGLFLTNCVVVAKKHRHRRHKHRHHKHYYPYNECHWHGSKRHCHR